MATNIRVINNKTGKPVTDVTPDNLKTFINNPQFSIDGSSLVPVDISGKQDLIPLNEYNPSTMKIRDGNYESNYQKYSSVGAQTQNISRQMANAFTLGGYAVVADRFKTEEELQDAKLREAFNPVGTFVGQTLPYLVPLAGEALGAARVGTTALRIGELTTAGMQSGAAKMVATAAVEGMAQGFTVGVNEASLDNELTRETLGNVMFQTLLGGAAGAAVGGVVAGIGKATSNVFGGLGEKLAKGKQSSGSVSPSEKLKADLSSVVDSASASQTELLQRNNNLELLQDLSQRIENNAQKISTGNAASLTADDAIANEVFSGLAANENLINDAVNGKIDLRTHVDNLMRYKDLSKKAGQQSGYVESNPRQMLSNDFHGNIESIQSVAKDFNMASVAFEKNLISESVENSPMLQSQLDNIYTTVYGGEKSLAKSAVTTIDNYSTPEGIFKRLNEQFPNASKDTIESVISSEMSQYNKSLLSSFKSAIQKRGLELENIPNPSASDVYKFLDNSVSDLDSAWSNYKASLPLGTKPNPKEAKLFSELKTPLYNEIANPDAAIYFGETAVKRSQSKAIRAQLMSAESELKKLIGQKSKGEIDLKKLNKLKSVGMGQGNTELSRKAMDVVTNYLEQIKEVIPKMKQVYPDLDDAALQVLQQKAVNAEQNLRDIFLVNDKRVNDFWKVTEKAGDVGAQGHVSGKTRGIRIAHDLIEGNFLYAKMQAMGALSDKFSGKLIDSLTKASTPQEVMSRRIRAINAIKKHNESIVNKISTVAKSLTVKPLPIGGITSATVPYITMNRLDKGAKDEIDKRYKEITNQINGLITQTEDRILQSDAHMKSLETLTPNLQGVIQNDLLSRSGIIAKALPKQSPATYGKADLSTAEKAHFLDQVDAGMNPEKMLDLISRGTITPSQLQIFQQMYPVMFTRLKNESLSQLSLAKGSLPPQSKARIYGMFNIPTAPSLSGNNLLKEAMSASNQQIQPNQGQQSGMSSTIRQNPKGNKSLTDNYKFDNKP